MEELELLIQDAKHESECDRKKYWREDIEEKAFADGEIRAYQYCLAMIKKIQSEIVK